MPSIGDAQTEGQPEKDVSQSSTRKSSNGDYKTDYILVRQRWMFLDVTAVQGLNSSHTWTTLDGSERRVLVF
jgi:hypothetical protein